MHSIPARRISDEPLINLVHRHVFTFFLLVYVVGLLYVSFVPFDFTAHPRSHHGMRELSGMSMSIYAVSDLLVNVVMYMPLGFLAIMAVRRLGFGRESAMIACLGMGTLLSFVIEKGQIWTVSRVSAWSDVAANSIGTFLGIMAYFFLEPSLRAATRHIQSLVRRNVWLMAGQVMVAAILLIQLRPYDVVVDPARTAKTLRHVDPRPLSRWNALPGTVRNEIGIGRRVSMTELTRVQWEYMLDRVSDVASYALLAAVITMGLVRSGRSWAPSAFSAGVITAGLAAAITIIRVFLISHGLDTLHFVCALAAWPVGCVAAWLWGRRDGHRSTLVVAALFAAVLCMTSLYGMAPFEWGDRHGSISWGPFFKHFGSRVNDAFMDISGDVLRYGLLAGVLAVWSSRVRLPWRMRSGVIVGCIAVFAAVLECCHLFIPFRHADMTSAYLAVSGGFIAVVAVRWAQDYFTSRVVIADDALTSALIEGESYDKSAAITPGSRYSDASQRDRVGSLPPV